ncbi:hypothetical protein UlMin_008292 [Ulmus minor]
MTVAHITRLKSNLLPLQPKTKWSLFSHPSFLPFSSTSPNASVLEKAKWVMSLFEHCSTMKVLNQIHAHIIQIGFNQNLFVMGKIVEFCAASERGDMDYAVSVFDSIRIPDGFLWNTMIRGFGKSSKPEKAFEFYKRMQERGEVADNFTFNFLIKISGQLGSYVLGKQIHCLTIKNGLESHVYVRNNLIHMYGMLKDMETALQLFDEIPSPDLVAWNTILDCHVYCGNCKEALDLFERMLQGGIQPDKATIVVTLSACSSLGALDFGRWIHSYIKNTSLPKILPVSNSLIDMYAKSGALEEAFETFKNMSGKDLVSWNTMILGLAAHGYTNEALGLFSNMLKEKHERPDGVTFLGVLCACSHGGMVEEGRKYFDSMSKEYAIQPTMKHYGCMVDILGRAGMVEEAYQLIMSMPMECNAIVWRTLLAACRVHDNVELGEKVRKQLLKLEPDHSSDYVLLANMYASVGKWNEVMRVRESMRDRRVQKAEPGNSLIGSHPRSRMNMDSNYDLFSK